MMDIHQVNSQEAMLNESDIVLVAAHMTDPTQEINEAAKKNGVTAERMLYTIYIQQMQDPALIRIRNGNTLFTIAALEGRVGFVFVYNGDAQENVAQNFMEFIQAAYKMGFNILVVNCADDSLNNSAKEIESSVQNAKLMYDAENDLLYVEFLQPHGDQ